MKTKSISISIGDWMLWLNLCYFLFQKDGWGGAVRLEDTRGDPVRGAVSDERVERIPDLYPLFGQHRRDRHADRHRSQPHPDRTAENVNEKTKHI